MSDPSREKLLRKVHQALGELIQAHEQYEGGSWANYHLKVNAILLRLHEMMPKSPMEEWVSWSMWPFRVLISLEDMYSATCGVVGRWQMGLVKNEETGKWRGLDKVARESPMNESELTRFRSCRDVLGKAIATEGPRRKVKPERSETKKQRAMSHCRDCRDRGTRPKLSQIVEVVGCAESTASRARAEVEAELANDVLQANSATSSRNLAR